MGDPINTLYAMRQAGYTFRTRSTCKACGQPIDWWLTTNKRLIPFDPTPADPTEEQRNQKVTMHRATCPKRDEFKSARDLAADTAAVRSKAACDLHRVTRARAVIVLYDEGQVLAWSSGLNSEDIRNEAIAAANKLRWQIRLGKDQV